MAPFENLTLRPRAKSADPRIRIQPSASREVADLLAGKNTGVDTIDVTYQVVWTADEPATPDLQTLLPVWHFPWAERELNFLRRTGYMSREELFSARRWPETPPGSVRITGSAAEGSIWSRFQPQDSYSSTRTPQPMPEGKMPCIAMLHRQTLGALSTCLYDKATDKFSNFSINDQTWAIKNGYHDHGDVQMSTTKWVQGSWVSVKDDNGNDFLFLTVERGYGLVRVWRPNVVAKRVIGSGETMLTDEEYEGRGGSGETLLTDEDCEGPGGSEETKLTEEECERLGLNEDAEF